MDTIRNLVIAAAANRRDANARGEHRSLIGFHDPAVSTVFVGGSQRHEGIREDLLFSCLNDQLRYPGEGAVVLVPDKNALDLLWGEYGNDPRFVFFPYNAYYNPFSGLDCENFRRGMDELLSRYIADNPGTPSGAHSVLDLIVEIMHRYLGDDCMTCSNFSVLANELAFASVGSFTDYLAQTFGQPVSPSVVQNLNRHWAAGVPAFAEFFRALQRQLVPVQAPTRDKFGLIEAVRESRIAVIALPASSTLLRGAVFREIGFLAEEKKLFSLYGMHVSVDEKMAADAFANLTAAPHFCLIGTTVGSVGLGTDTIRKLRPSVGCFGLDGTDAEALANLYNANYRAVIPSPHLGHGLMIGFQQAMMPMIAPADLLEERIPYGGVYLLMPGSHRRITHLFIR